MEPEEEREISKMVCLLVLESRAMIPANKILPSEIPKDHSLQGVSPECLSHRNTTLEAV